MLKLSSPCHSKHYCPNKGALRQSDWWISVATNFSQRHNKRQPKRQAFKESHPVAWNDAIEANADFIKQTIKTKSAVTEQIVLTQLG